MLFNPANSQTVKVLGGKKITVNYEPSNYLPMPRDQFLQLFGDKVGLERVVVMDGEAVAYYANGTAFVPCFGDHEFAAHARTILFARLLDINPEDCGEISREGEEIIDA